MLEDVGEEEEEEAASSLAAAASSSSSSSQPAAASSLAAAIMPQPGVSSESGAVDKVCMPGLDKVDTLAECLELRNQPSMTLSNQTASNIVALWHNLDDYDKKIVFSARHQSRLDTGRFGSSKKKEEFTAGVDSVKSLTTTGPLQ